MRVFAAVLPPSEVVEHLDTFLDVRRAAADFRWTSADQFHLTLAFAAEASEWRVEEYAERLADSLTGVRPPEARLAGAMAFPNPAEARVLAVAVNCEGDDAAVLRSLSVKARNAAVASGIEVDGAGFRPHVTVARMRRPDDVTRWFQLLESYDGPDWTIDRVALVASHLGEGPRRGPRHEVLAEIPFA